MLAAAASPVSSSATAAACFCGRVQQLVCASMDVSKGKVQTALYMMLLQQLNFMMLQKRPPSPDNNKASAAVVSNFQ
jgi:hypothetical protein